MPGFNAAALAYKVRSGNAVAILVGDQVVGFGQSSSFNTEFGTEGLYGIGSANPQEIQQLKNSMKFTLDVFQLTAQGLAILGQPQDLGEVLANNAFNISALDINGNPIRTMVGAVADNNNISIPANAVVTEAVSFTCLDILGPNGQSLLAGSNAIAGLTLATTALSSLGVPQP